MMKKNLFCLFIFYLASYTTSLGQTFKVGGINYNVLSKTTHTAAVGKNHNYAQEQAVIPRQVNYQGVNYQVVAIADSAFIPAENHDGVKCVRIEKGVKSIGKCAFSQCYDLTEAVLPEGLEEIGDEAFSHCEGLWDMALPEGLERIGHSAFAECHFSTFKAPSTLKSIGSYAFYNKGLTKVELNEELDSIGDFAFSNNISLEHLSLPRQLKYMGRGAFSITGIRQISIPPTWKHVPEKAFEDCPELHQVTFYEGLERIGGLAFSCCSNLKSLTLPKTLKRIDKEAFDLIALRNVTIKNPRLYLGKDALKICCDIYAPNISSRSDHPEVATTDKDGNLLIHGQGTALITVKAKDSETQKIETAVCRVQIGNPIKDFKSLLDS